MGAADNTPALDGVRWLATKRVTLGVVSLLVVVFCFELLVWEWYGPSGWQYVFLAGVEPSPGWVMAPFSHRGVAHLLTTLTVIVIYGGFVEGMLRPPTYFAFYVVAGYASTLAQLIAYLDEVPGLGTLGASGAALGLVTLFVTTTAVQYRDDPAGVTDVEVVFAVTGVVISGLILTNDFVPGIVFTGGTAPLGHAGGMAAGLCYGLGRAQQGSTRRPEDEYG